MKWKKVGLVFDPRGKFSWARDSALQPTPLVLADRIRVFVGMRDKDGVSRVGFVDFSKDDPSTCIDFSSIPCLEIGEPGCFDDNGVVPSAILVHNEKLLLYYAGYQIVSKVRFLVLGGLAVSTDNGQTFSRYSQTPLFERTNNELLFRVPHSVIHENGNFRFWYGGGSKFMLHNGATLPSYDVRYLETNSPYSIPDSGSTVIKLGDDDYRLGRPYVIKRDDSYLMFFGVSTLESRYRLDFARSSDGLNWLRSETGIGLSYSLDDFDSDMSAYPGIVVINDRIYMYYNGNDYGRGGIGLAILETTL
jgi:hypothetical protein